MKYFREIDPAEVVSKNFFTQSGSNKGWSKHKYSVIRLATSVSPQLAEKLKNTKRKSELDKLLLKLGDEVLERKEEIRPLFLAYCAAKLENYDYVVSLSSLHSQGSLEKDYEFMERFLLFSLASVGEQEKIFYHTELCEAIVIIYRIMFVIMVLNLMNEETVFDKLQKFCWYHEASDLFQDIRLAVDGSATIENFAKALLTSCKTSTPTSLEIIYQRAKDFHEKVFAGNLIGRYADSLLKRLAEAKAQIAALKEKLKTTMGSLNACRGQKGRLTDIVIRQSRSIRNLKRIVGKQGL